MQAVQERGSGSYPISSAPYSAPFNAQARLELGPAVFAMDAAPQTRTPRKAWEIVSLRRTFWCSQLTAFAFLIAAETLPTQLGSGLPYVKFVGLGLLLIATECAFLHRRRSAQNNAPEKEEETEPFG